MSGVVLDEECKLIVGVEILYWVWWVIGVVLDLVFVVVGVENYWLLVELLF